MVEMRSRGMSQTEIVRELQVSLEETCLYKRLLLDYTYVLIEFTPKKK